MVCGRCIKVVKTEIENLGFNISKINLGEVEIEGGLENEDKIKLEKTLVENGFELLDDRKAAMVEKIKNIVIDQIHYNEDKLQTNFSALISEQIPLDYNYVSHLFSSLEGITIEKYIILQRIEKAKELLVYDELTLSEIAWKLGYSSVHHLSSQFKKITGLTPSHFKQIKEIKRNSLDQVNNKP